MANGRASISQKLVTNQHFLMDVRHRKYYNARQTYSDQVYLTTKLLPEGFSFYRAQLLLYQILILGKYTLDFYVIVTYRNHLHKTLSCHEQLNMTNLRFPTTT